MGFPFNVRVYGILIHNGNVLLSDESYSGKSFTKFPGGALEFGEGLIDAVKREFIEEVGLKVSVLDHFYTTDFFQPSAFNPNHQLISVYYLVEAISSEFEPASLKSMEAHVSMHWVRLSDLEEAHLTFPVDKHIVQQIKGLSR